MKELNIIQTRLNAPKNRYNSFFNGYYRSAEDILEALKPLLKETGCIITCTDDIVSIEGRLFVRATATLRNQGGEEVSAVGYAELNPSGMETRKKLDPAQLTGGASSYARKYAMNGLFAIDDNKDPDDGNLAKAVHEETKSKSKEQPKEPAKPKEPTKPKEPAKPKLPEMNDALWARMVENEVAGKKTRNGERIKDWWIKNYHPGVVQIKMFDEACLKKVGETVESTGTLPAGARQIMDDRNAGAATQQTAEDMPDFDNLFDNVKN